MELQFFLNILMRRKWLILLAAILATVATYFLVSAQPPVYKAQALISTGIIPQKGINMDNDVPFVQKHQIDISHGNLKNYMLKRKNIAFLSYNLLMHDLSSDINGTGVPFRTLEKEDKVNYAPSGLQKLYSQLSENLDSLTDAIPDQELESMYTNLVEAYEYDYEELLKTNFGIMDSENSDMIRVTFEAENPEMCSFAVNKYCEKFLEFYSLQQSEEERSLVEDRQNDFDAKRLALELANEKYNNYKQNKSLLDLSAQKSATVAQVKELEIALEGARKQIPALQKTLRELEGYLVAVRKDKGANNGEKAQRILTKKTIDNYNKQLVQLRKQYTQTGNKDRSLKKRIDLTQKQLESEISRLAKFDEKDGAQDDKRNAEAKERDLINKKLQAEGDLNVAKESVLNYEKELSRLRGKSSGFVYDQENIDNFKQEIDIAKGEFINASATLNNAKIALNNSKNPISIVERAKTPTKPEPSKKYLLSIFAGIVTGALATVSIFLLTYLDISLNTPFQFNKFTGLNLLATINEVDNSNLDLKQVFNSNSEQKGMEVFKESLRNLRYIVENSGAKTFLFTSTKDQEGKTFLISSLTYALSLKNKKILLVDTNFKNNELTRLSKSADSLGNSSRALIGENNLENEFEYKQGNGDLFNLNNVDILGNKGTNLSPSEVFAGKDFVNFIKKLSQNYDYIFLEGASLNRYSDSKELVSFVDKVIAVFSAESEIKQIDKNSIAYLESLDQKFLGGVLNKVDLKNMN
ncbi:MAG: exopolysaccharide transport family protein [Saprospiraceae bacterium]